MSATAATSARDAFMPRRPRGLGMGFTLAVLAHVLLILALAFSVNWHSHQVQGVEAELWSAVPQIAAPRATAPEPPPAPRPRPPEPPPKPVAKPEPAPPDPQIAIEKAKKEEALREQARQEELQRQKRKQEEREQQQREQAQRDAQERQQRELDRKKQQQEAAAQEAARQNYLKRMMGQAGATGDPSSPGTAARTSGPSSDYAGRVAAYIKQKIFFDNTQASGNPQAVVEIRNAPDGRILSRRLVKSSGVPAYDDAVLRAIDNAGVVPRDPNGVPPVMELTFRPKD